jgi:hypothetical protein
MVRVGCGSVKYFLGRSRQGGPNPLMASKKKEKRRQKGPVSIQVE